MVIQKQNKIDELNQMELVKLKVRSVNTNVNIDICESRSTKMKTNCYNVFVCVVFTFWLPALYFSHEQPLGLGVLEYHPLLASRC